jgi:predicted regulator of Ras-like GTPase activity (Roadblock/LC7/MglB family)
MAMALKVGYNFRALAVPFEVILQELVSSVEGATGAILLDADGEAVRWYTLGSSERLRLRAAYIAVAVQSCRTSSARLRIGPINHLIIQYDGASFLVKELEEGYFFALELNSSANLGQALNRIQPAVASLRQEMAA